MANFKPTSSIFDKTARRQVLAKLARKAAKRFKQQTKDRMSKGLHTGKESKRKGRRVHRASARGQRPAPDTKTLLKAVSDRKTGPFSAEVYIAEKTNPESGTVASRYAEILQGKLDRPIITEEDEREAERDFQIDGLVAGFQLS